MRPTANQLRAARAWLDMTQAEAAAAAGLNVNTVYKAERGDPVQVASLHAMAGAFRIRGVQFIGRDVLHQTLPGGVAP
jgi:DNA-binding XRE family transcriptional regulator